MEGYSTEVWGEKYRSGNGYNVGVLNIIVFLLMKILHSFFKYSTVKSLVTTKRSKFNRQ